MTERTPLYLVLLVVSLAIGGVMLREPLLQPFRDLATSTSEAEQKLAELKAEIAARQSTGQAGREILAAYGEPLKPATITVRSAAFYSWVETLALGSDLQVESIQPKAAQIDADGLVAMPLTVNLDGDLPGLVSFLAQLEAAPALVGVQRMSLRRRDRSERPLSVQMQMVAYGYLDAESRRARAQAAKRPARS